MIKIKVVRTARMATRHSESRPSVTAGRLGVNSVLHLPVVLVPDLGRTQTIRKAEPLRTTVTWAQTHEVVVRTTRTETRSRTAQLLPATRTGCRPTRLDAIRSVIESRKLDRKEILPTSEALLLLGTVEISADLKGTWTTVDFRVDPTRRRKGMPNPH